MIRNSSRVLILCSLAGLALMQRDVSAQAPAATLNTGPYNSTYLEGGVGESRKLSPDNAALPAGAPWSLRGWLRARPLIPALSHARGEREPEVLAGIGDLDHCRCLLIEDTHLLLQIDGTTWRADGAVSAGEWHAIAATFDGSTARVYVDGEERGHWEAHTTVAAPSIHLAPVVQHSHFGGSWAQFELMPRALAPAEIADWAKKKPDFDLIVFHQVGAGWPWQEHAWRGLLQPQDPWTLPKGKTPPSAPVAAPLPSSTPLIAEGANHWKVGAWRLAEEKVAAAKPEAISQASFDDRSWYAATVPGTVLTTLIDRGVYPDPYYGLNNLAIPERLARQNYWYRTTFDAPATLKGRRLTLQFNGINYTADVWLNGKHVGQIAGAFTRGIFDVTNEVVSGARNALAVRIQPPPHPGIPHEESIAAGPGENGGNLAIDGPTFIASEGWDWIPGIRDRNSGLWQDVELSASGALQLLDPHVVTDLPLPNIDAANVTITVPVQNTSVSNLPATVEASFGDVHISKQFIAAPGRSQVSLDPREFPQLKVAHPRLWWPNGYGPANLYSLDVAIRDTQGASDRKTVRFGIRELTYELSLFDAAGHLRRVEVNPTLGNARGEKLIDVRHEAIKQTPNGWAESLTAAGETSPAVHNVSSESLAPYLVIRVNGVPIAARGGSWGTDDARKRIDRARLEPYFELHREAHLNIIRNWLGQNTEPVFYDLADEYGMLVLNDFWASTQDFQVEPQDPALFLANARDVIERYRNHPSIAVWFGRNEGVPQPIINEGLDALVAELDGTRYFTGSSNNINLQGSGPYNYRPAEQYFTQLARGFSVEVGAPSLATLEALQAMVPPADRWPLSDTLAYHDWHFGGNGDVASFMHTLERRFGAPTSLEDFERKGQLLNYETYRAVFEGFQAHLWDTNSGRLLWMTHPSWPSNSWQIYSSDYDTHAAYYGVKKACEPIHVQMNLPDFALAVVNTTRDEMRGLTLESRVVDLDNREWVKRTDRVNAPANRVTTLPVLDVAKALARTPFVVVKLRLLRGTLVISENTYWQARDEASFASFNRLESQPVQVSAALRHRDNDEFVAATVTNTGKQPVFSVKLTAQDEAGQRVLPAFYGDNYLMLLPGESRVVEVRCRGAQRCAQIGVRGWNVTAATGSIAGK